MSSNKPLKERGERIGDLAYGAIVEKATAPSDAWKRNTTAAHTSVCVCVSSFSCRKLVELICNVEAAT